jgi:hypothetical protein
LREHQDRIEAAGASIAAVGLGDLRHATAFKEEVGIRFPLLVDAERQAYRAVGLKQGSLLHLLRGDNADARRRAKRAGHRQHRLGKNPFQLGGSFVFGPGDVDRFAHVSETFGDNALAADLLAAISEG